MDKIEKIIKDKKQYFIIKMVIWTFIGSMVLYIVIMGITLNLGESISFGESLTYFGSVLAACVTVFGVMWQIEKNNEKIEEEKEIRMKNLKSYINFVITRNLEIYFSEEKNTKNKFYKVILEILKNKEISLLKLTNGIIYPFDKEYISKNLEEILKLENGEKILELHDELKNLEFTINENLKEVINESKFVENREMFIDNEEIDNIFSILSLINNIFFYNLYPVPCYERLKKKYFSEITEMEWKNNIKFENEVQKYDAYLYLIGLTIKKMNKQEELNKISLNLQNTYLILNKLKREEEKISELIIKIGVLS